MSDTPRTDAENWIHDMGFDKFVSMDFARELERELAAAIKERDEAQREVCEMIARTRRKAGIRGSTVGLDRVAPEAIAAERGWDCFAKEGGGA